MSDIWSQAETESQPGYVRIAQLGLSGTGKTFSSVMLALEIRERFGLTGPVAALDTENGFDFLRPIVRQVTGQPLLVVKSRNLDTWNEAIDRAADRGNMVLIGDSVTHVWKQLCDGYLRQLQETGRAKGWRKIPQALQFKDWNPIKQHWAEFTDRFMNAPVHQIMNGRAGWLWDMESDGQNGKELVKKDVKMRAEGEFEFESGLSLLYERHRATLDAAAEHTVTVRKDRTDRIMGQVFRFTPKKTPPRAIAQFVAPHLDALCPAAFSPVDTASVHDFQIDRMGNESRQREEQDRAIALEKLEAALLRKYPGQTAAAKGARAEALKNATGTSSWTEVEKRFAISLINNATAAIEDGDELEL